MDRVSAPIGGLAAGLAIGLALAGLVGVADAQESIEPTGRTVNADGDAVRAVPDANGNYSANGDGEDVVYGDIGPGTVIGEPTVIETTGDLPVESAEPASEPVGESVAPEETAAEPVLEPEVPIEAPEVPVDEADPAPPVDAAPEESVASAPDAETPSFDSFTISNEDGDAAAYGVPGRPEDSNANARPGRIEGIPGFQEVSAAQEVPAAEPAPATDAAPAPTGPPVAETAPIEVAAPPAAFAPAASCGDFPTWYDAQVAYEAEGGVDGDPALVASLDPDADGIACEEAMEG